jgi:hypothetical protein
VGGGSLVEGEEFEGDLDEVVHELSLENTD